MSGMNLDFSHAFEDFKKVFEQRIAELSVQAKASTDSFQQLLDNAVKKFNLDTAQIITTKSNDEKICYTTTIMGLAQSITNEFPSQEPNADDVYWKRHVEQVDAALATRKEIVLKVLETVSSIIQGVVSPTK